MTAAVEILSFDTFGFDAALERIERVKQSFDQEYTALKQRVFRIQQQSNADARAEELAAQQAQEQAEAQQAMQAQQAEMAARRQPYYISAEEQAIQPAFEEPMGLEAAQAKQAAVPQMQAAAAAAAKKTADTAKAIAGRRLVNILWFANLTVLGIIVSFVGLHILFFASMFSKDSFWRQMKFLEKVALVALDLILFLVIIILIYAIMYTLCDSFTAKLGASLTTGTNVWSFCKSFSK